ncbi:hypothetical protein LEP1GSC045_1966 [Leptospira interrogans serovar Pomona str. Kennewicki LC82-25]|nr:hypothetical protein LEP1GSC045_1966 [Leptospira interrogans serovar Pomona str. Kennewicki LC82-25]EKN95750.1 hypothetical protein LEP1GSC014_1809 [Leptospira interrogans serovar Pomona str. Pomona]EMF35357.1 hypothetical protein LEP1GSC201_2060 [Leptospira interrogans serovar Pomona str. Fox 32256]EMI66743.1 hypothetical protein LEP1GSC200_0837 [Leptospira interrogans serovar Pomona str. CSL10083]EMJ58501.1 hypothetical protein LEP1GSC197_0449 [Leptospira interrogans serovar Pomona str. CS
MLVKLKQDRYFLSGEINIFILLRSKLKNKNKIFTRSLKKLNITSIITLVQDFLKIYND